MMSRTLITVLLALMVAACAPSYRYYDGTVDGYYREDGSYVERVHPDDPYYQRYYRTEPLYIVYPSYYSLFWGVNRYAYDPFFHPGFYYGVTWYPHHYMGWGWSPRYAGYYGPARGYRYNYGFAYGWGYSPWSYPYGYYYVPPRQRRHVPQLTARDEARRLSHASGGAAGLMATPGYRSMPAAGRSRTSDPYRPQRGRDHAGSYRAGPGASPVYAPRGAASARGAATQGSAAPRARDAVAPTTRSHILQQQQSTDSRAAPQVLRPGVMSGPASMPANAGPAPRDARSDAPMRRMAPREADSQRSRNMAPRQDAASAASRGGPAPIRSGPAPMGSSAPAAPVRSAPAPAPARSSPAPRAPARIIERTEEPQRQR